MPSVDFSNSDAFYRSDANNFASDWNSFDNGVTPLATRLMSATASGLSILPMQLVAPNSSYDLGFHGPSMRCEEPSTIVSSIIDMTYNYTSYVTTQLYMNSRFDTPLAWVAFAPTGTLLGYQQEAESEPQQDFLIDFKNGQLNQTLVALVGNCITGLKATPGSFLCEGISNATGNNNGQIWLRAQNQSYVCSLTDTHYTAHFKSLNASQNIENYTFEYTTQTPYDGYFGIAQTISHWLTGALRGFQHGAITYNTRITTTALMGVFNTTSGMPEDSKSTHLSDVFVTNELKALAGGLTAGQLVEELSRNLTLSLFSAPSLL